MEVLKDRMAIGRSFLQQLCGGFGVDSPFMEQLIQHQ